MSTKLIILELLEKSRITSAEALQLLTSLRQSQSPEALPAEKQAILVKILDGREKNV
jgi:hypothetical protein